MFVWEIVCSAREQPPANSTMHRANWAPSRRPSTAVPSTPATTLFRPSTIKFVRHQMPSQPVAARRPRSAGGTTDDKHFDVVAPMPELPRSSEPGELTKAAISARRAAHEMARRRSAAADQGACERAEAQLTAAREGHRKAVGMLRVTSARERVKAETLEVDRKDAVRKRRAALDALAVNTELAADAAAKSSSARVAQREAAQRKRQAELAELEALACRGSDNPYLVMRQREMQQQEARERRDADAQQAARLARIKADVAAARQREAKMGERIAREDEERAGRRAHVNEPFLGGPRTQCFASCVELG